MKLYCAVSIRNILYAAQSFLNNPLHDSLNHKKSFNVNGTDEYLKIKITFK